MVWQCQIINRKAESNFVNSALILDCFKIIAWQRQFLIKLSIIAAVAAFWTHAIIVECDSA